jgi:hypothetical protein
LLASLNATLTSDRQRRLPHIGRFRNSLAIAIATMFAFYRRRLVKVAFYWVTTHISALNLDGVAKWGVECPLRVQLRHGGMSRATSAFTPTSDIRLPNGFSEGAKVGL